MLRVILLIGLLFATMGPAQSIGSPSFPIPGNGPTNLPQTAQAIHPPKNPVAKFLISVHGTYKAIQPYASHQNYMRHDTEEPHKKIIICLTNQEMYLFEDGKIISVHLVSTGTAAHRTPPGDYSIKNKAPSAWSNKYECTMLHWMALTRNGEYGIHGLTGNSYLRKLGHVASHGCVRLSRTDAELTYDWAEIGIPVTIVQDFDPIPFLAPPTATLQPVEIFPPGSF